MDNNKILPKSSEDCDLSNFLCSARNVSILTPTWQQAPRAVRRSLLAEDSERSGGGSLSELNARSQSTAQSGSGADNGGDSGPPLSALKTPQTPLRAHHLYSFGEGPILSEVAFFKILSSFYHIFANQILATCLETGYFKPSNSNRISRRFWAIYPSLG